MAETKAQNKWRDKYRFIKTQLNVMGLEEIASTYKLKGKAEAVAFCCFITRAQMQRGWNDPKSKMMLDSLVASFRGQRDIYSP